MAKDLAIDVGIPVDTDEFHTFVACVDNILTHGCGYGDELTVRIVEKCHTSDLPIAKKILRECRRISRNTSGIRPSRSKWWETYNNRKNSDVPRWPGRKPDEKRGMCNKKRPMSPMFNKRKRPMSPMFNERTRGHRDHIRNNDYRNDRRNDNRRNDNDQHGKYRESYRYQRSPSPVYERNSKKRKYR